MRTKTTPEKIITAAIGSLIFGTGLLAFGYFSQSVLLYVGAGLLTLVFILLLVFVLYSALHRAARGGWFLQKIDTLFSIDYIDRFADSIFKGTRTRRRRSRDDRGIPTPGTVEYKEQFGSWY